MLKHMNKTVAKYSSVAEHKSAEIISTIFIEQPVDKFVQLLGFALHLVVAAIGKKQGPRLIFSNFSRNGVDCRLNHIIGDTVFKGVLDGGNLGIR